MKEVINHRYCINNLIGQGGMADVYLAFDLILKRDVAIKIVRSRINEDPMLIVRFFREASAAAKLAHRNIVSIYDVGEDEDVHYIVMEYVKGPTLKRLLQLRGALGLSESLSIMQQLSYAVKEAHDHHIIHRDIKPQNILIKADGTVKITDFGIAVSNHSVSLTHNEAVMGSAQYLPPETAQKLEPNECFDIYSMGIVFFELLAGHPPYDGSSPTQIALAHITEPFPSIRRINPEIPVSVENVIRKATAKDPQERYQNVLEFIEDLESCTDPRASQEPIVLKTEILALNPEPEKHEKTGKKDRRTRKTGSKTIAEPEAKPRRSALFYLGSLLVVALFAVLILTVSWGSILRLVGFLPFPNVTAMEPAAAIELLGQTGFNEDSIETETILSDSVQSGQIAEASVESGQYTYRNSQITLYISKGPSYLVEDYTGLDLQSFEQLMESESIDLDLQIDYEPNSSVRAGTILSQQGLEPGTRIDPNEKYSLKLTVAAYPTIIIPEEILGMDIYEAKEYLNSVGAAVVFKNYYGTGTVLDIDPGVGQSYTQQGTDTVITIIH